MLEQHVNILEMYKFADMNHFLCVFSLHQNLIAHLHVTKPTAK